MKRNPKEKKGNSNTDFSCEKIMNGNVIKCRRVGNIYRQKQHILNMQKSGRKNVANVHNG